MGEGAGVVVLEELEHAKARGAKILAEVVGYGCNRRCVPHPHPLQKTAPVQPKYGTCSKRGGISTDDVWYVNAHGTSTHP